MYSIGRVIMMTRGPTCFQRQLCILNVGCGLNTALGLIEVRQLKI